MGGLIRLCGMRLNSLFLMECKLRAILSLVYLNGSGEFRYSLLNSMCLICALALTIIHPGLFFSQSALLKQGKPFSKRNNTRARTEEAKLETAASTPYGMGVGRAVEEGGQAKDQVLR